jgi:HPt (histidine-containing phosphotransfer) domain-containing protein
MTDAAAINWEQLDMIADGYTPDFVEIYREFEVDLPRIIGEVEQGLAAGDAVMVARAAHQAKGSAANFGFFGFSGIMSRVETQAKSGSLTGLDGEVQSAKQLFADSLSMVKSERGM